MDEFDRDEVARQMCSTKPRCLEEFVVTPAKPPEPWDFKNLAVWQLSCQCGSENGRFLGYPLRQFVADYSGDAFVSPLGFECSKCGKVSEVLDTNQHGYHAEACSAPSHIRGEGERAKFVCGCGNAEFVILTSFFYWEAAIDLVEDEPEEFSQVAQNLFNEFIAHGRCATCGEVSRFTDFGKL